MTQTKENKQSLATKLAAIGREIGAVDKSGKNTQQNYAYIEYGVVAGRIRELFDKYHVIIIPSVESVQQDEIMNKYGGKGYHYVLTMTFDIVNGDDPDDREIASWTGEASDYGDKGINKAETAGTKYFLMRLFNVSEKGEEEADKSTPSTVVASESRRTGRQFTKTEISAAKVALGMATDMQDLKARYSKLGEVALEREVIDYKDDMKAKFEGVQNG